MEQLASLLTELRNDPDAHDHAFLTGILSLLDSIYSISMDEVLAALNLSEEIRDALTSRSGIYGKLLVVAESLENMDFTLMNENLQELGISQEDLLAAQVKAYSWRGGAA